MVSGSGILPVKGEIILDQKLVALQTAVSTAMHDDELMGDAELKQILTKFSAKLATGKNYEQVAGEMNQALRFWGMGHLYGPKGLDPLYQATVAAAPGISAQKPYSTPQAD